MHNQNEKKGNCLFILIASISLIFIISFLLSCKTRGKERYLIPHLEMVGIPGGEFMMGANNGETDEIPIHKVKIRPFYMSRTEITVKQFRMFIQDTRYKTDAERRGGMISTPKGRIWEKKANWKTPFLSQTDDHPVVLVSWNDARAFCRWMWKKTGLRFRLPTEAEWEYACRAGSIGEYYGQLDMIAWYEYNSNGMTHPVKQKKANLFGLFDMTGNVWEWCNDWYEKRYYKVSPFENPNGPLNGKYKVNRGGSWCSKPQRLRVSFREHDPPDFAFYRIGFRVAYSSNPH